MNGYYPRYPPEGGEDNMVGGVMGQDGMSSSGMVGAQSLDDIVNENAKAMRRRSVPVAFGNNTPVTMGEQDMRRVSMMEFGGTSPPLDSFAFDPNAGSLDGMMRSENSYYTTQNSQFPTSATGYSNMQAASSLDVDMASPYMASNLGMSMDMSDQAFNNMTGNDVSSMGMYGQSQFGSPMMGSPVHADFNTVMAPTTQVGGMRLNDPQEQLSTTDKHSATPDMPSRTSSQNQSARSNSRPQSTPLSSNRSPQHQMSASQFGPEAPPPSSVPTSQPPSAYSQLKFPWVDPPGGFPSSMHGRTHIDGQFKNAYSQTGFDMLGVLMRVATRPNPEINIGSVDLSCAFVVCDAEKDDNPIVYCSENFERLTGYDRHMILGRNCRFLQSPDGKVQPGQKRQFCDDDSVLYLKNCISMRRESQISLINYRRGGQPFMNLLTMIPISWDSDVTKFFVGFQVDLVEQPNAVTNKNADGTYAINYQRGITMPRYIAPGERVQHELAGQTISREEVSTILSSFGTTGDSEFTKRVWDKVLLENADDVVHVLSLKGLFLYLSPSSKKILEYEPNELVGTALSSVCHPSDIVPVTRELKDTSSGVSVNVVFRIRRKLSGYMWWEGNGSLHTEQGKGRKCIILVGRERPVYTLNKHHILEAGGIGENELWTKMSTTGMFLYVSSNVRQLLDRHPDELVGTSIQALMRQDSKQEFGRILMLAYTGKRASVKHEMMNKRGQILQAFTTIYPGDAVEGQKPTFLIAQTRMLKFSRSSNQTNHRNSLLGKADSAGGVTPLSTIGSTSQVGNTGNNTPMSLQGNKFATTEGSAATYAGSNGLPLGRQDASLASDENLFEELKTVRSTSWQFELRQMEKRNRLLAEEVQSLLAAKKKRKRRKGAGQLQKDCANCHTRVTPEWRRGPSGNRDLCNSCGLRWAKQNGRVSPRTSSQQSVSAQSDRGSKASASPRNQSSSMKAPETSGESTPQLPDGHGTKAARIEVAASQGVVPSVPPPIKEANEQDG